MSSINTHRKMSMWAGAANSTALLLTGCSPTVTSAPAGTDAPSSTVSAAGASFSPTPSAATRPSTTPTKTALKTHKIANGHFQITMPPDWKLEKLANVAAQVHHDSTASVKIVAAVGRQLAEIRTGGEEIWDIVSRVGQATNTVYDTAGNGDFGSLNYAFLSYDGQADKAEMIITALDSDSAKTRGDKLEGLLYTGGSGEFSATLTSQAKLPGVTDSLKGAQRFKAYAKTDEYSRLKKTMLSFKQLKDVAPAGSEAATAGQCTGVKYTHELGESGLSCDEAKSFLTRMLKEPIHTGAVEITGEGGCLFAMPNQPGSCNVESAGGTFNFSLE